MTWVRDFEGIAPVYYVFGNGKYGKGSEAVFSSDLVPFESKDFKSIASIEALEQRDLDLTCDSLNGWEELLPNTLSALSHLKKNYDFDFIIRTNLSTYWNKTATIRMIRDFNQQDVFAGPIIQQDTFRLIPGYAMVLSNNAIENILSNLNLLDSRVVDDVAISRALDALSQKFENVFVPWVTVKNYFELMRPKNRRESIRENGIKSLSDLDKFPALRCREDRSIGSLSVRLDILHFLVIRVAIGLRRLLKFIESQTRVS